MPLELMYLVVFNRGVVCWWRC